MALVLCVSILVHTQYYSFHTTNFLAIINNFMKTFEQWLEGVFDDPVLGTAPPVPGSYGELGKMVKKLPPGVHLKDILAATAGQEQKPPSAPSRVLPQGGQAKARVPERLNMVGRRIQARYNAQQKVQPDNNVF